MKQIQKDIAEILKKEKDWIMLQDNTEQKKLLIHLHRERVIDLSDIFEKEEKKKPYGNQFIIIDGKKMFYFNPKEFKKRCGGK